jgi:hypothetical protein
LSKCFGTFSIIYFNSKFFIFIWILFKRFRVVR